VIRLSKQYLPGMAAGFNDPRVTVHVGDGFKFLDDYKNTFDVIITDSSDPDGPAESLFQKSYFQLLFDALREGGVITTQGCMFSSSGVWVFCITFGLWMLLSTILVHLSLNRHLLWGSFTLSLSALPLSHFRAV